MCTPTKQIKKKPATPQSGASRMEVGKGKRRGFTESQLAFIVMKKKAGNNICIIPSSKENPKKVTVRDLSKYTLVSADEDEESKNYFCIPMPCRLKYGPKKKHVLPIKLKRIDSGEYVYDTEDEKYQRGLHLFFKDRLVDNRVVGVISDERIVEKLKVWLHDKIDCERGFLDAYLDSYNFRPLLDEAKKDKFASLQQHDMQLSEAGPPDPSLGRLEELLCQGFRQLTTSQCQTNHDVARLAKTFAATSEQVAETSRIAAENKVGLASVNRRVDTLHDKCDTLHDQHTDLQIQVNGIRDSIRKGWNDVLKDEMRQNAQSVVPVNLFDGVAVHDNAQKTNTVEDVRDASDGGTTVGYDNDYIDSSGFEGDTLNASIADETAIAADGFQSPARLSVPSIAMTHLTNPSPVPPAANVLPSPARLSAPCTAVTQSTTSSPGRRTAMSPHRHRIAPAARTPGRRKGRRRRGKRPSESNLDFIPEMLDEEVEEEEENGDEMGNNLGNADHSVSWDTMVARADAARQQALDQIYTLSSSQAATAPVSHTKEKNERAFYFKT
mmetsp:Transcript_45361/g.110361  ORF Transcript_45361/g.110361 Transcript_45361/m.110361 type:complete len:553 (-) Transcript_45361:285-1943(-)